MALVFNVACAEYAATVAALNARALGRAGLLEDLEIGLMHVMLDQLEARATDDDEERVCRSLRQALPVDPEGG